MKSSKALQDKNSLVEQISKFFEKEKVEQMARETKFVQRESPLTGMDFFILCLFAHQQNYEISLEGLSNELLKDGTSITKQSINERFNDHSVEFMQQMLNAALSQKLNMKVNNKHPVFNRIIIEDSTSFQLPAQFAGKYKGCGGGASDAAVKIQYTYDLLSQNILVMLVQAGINSDNKQELGEVKKTTCVSSIWDISNSNDLLKYRTKTHFIYPD